MGFAPEKKVRDYVKSLIKHTEFTWHILLLPNGQWACLWWASLECEYAQCVYDGDYDSACAFVGDKKDALEFVLKELAEAQANDPLNHRFDISKIKSRFFRKNSKLNKYV